MKPIQGWILLGLGLCGFFACKDPQPSWSIKVFRLDQENHGWQVGYADYPEQADVETFYQFAHGLLTLPSPLQAEGKALMVEGSNHSDDLLMYITRPFSGLLPNRIYEMHLLLKFASDQPANAVGVGGSPGSSVFVKLGSSTQEPKVSLDPQDHHYRLNIDVGSQSQSGADAQMVGDISNGLDRVQWAFKTLSTTGPLKVKTDALGRCWLFAGTDSGFEAKTRVYYQEIQVNFRLMP